jgi:formate hydrogenlyase subunit 6/NADH:ubiquinone oxidoreductase subunit I
VEKFFGEEPMAYKITADCTMCGTCADECPSAAIKEGKETYTIDQEACTECGTCVDVCPSEAIVEA